MIGKKKETYVAIEGLLNWVNTRYIREDQDVQRFSGAWTNQMTDELIYTILSNDYVTPVILAEQKDPNGKEGQLWLVDGLQRTTALNKFLNFNHRIGNSLERSMVEYKRNKKTAEGRPVYDETGDYATEWVEIDVKGKTFDELPDELKSNFKLFTLPVMIHQDCLWEDVSTLVRRYNNHRAMNLSQTSFTYVDKFARKIKNITNHDFFKLINNYKDGDRRNGRYQRNICEAIMTREFLQDWKPSPKNMNKFLNVTATMENFIELEEDLTALTEIIKDNRFSYLFGSKNFAIWTAVFKEFKTYNIDYKKFVDFINAFEDTYKYQIIDKNLSFVDYDDEFNRKNKKIIQCKISFIVNCLKNYFEKENNNIEENNNVANVKNELEQLNKEVITENLSEIVKVEKNKIENVNQTNSDGKTFNENENLEQETRFDLEKFDDETIELFNDILDDLITRVDRSSPLLKEENRKALLMIVGYAFENEIDLDDWFVNYINPNNKVFNMPWITFIYMKKDLLSYVKQNNVKSA